MINRSSNISARRSNGGSGGGGGNIVVLADHESSKMKEKRKGSKSSSLLLPLLIAAVILLLIDNLRLFRPSSSIDEEDNSLALRSDSTASLRKPSDSSSDTSTNKNHHLTNSDTKYKLIPKHQFPKGWQHFSYEDIRHHFNCRQRSKDMNKPLPSLEDWNFMRQTYAQIVNNHGKKATTTLLPWENDLVPPTLGYSLTPTLPIPPPYYAKLSPGKGRGLFASRNIQKGELVHDGTVSDVIFPNAMTFREFVFSFDRKEYACDAAEWVWMQQLEKGGEYHLLMGISISALMNAGGAEWGDAQSKKVNCMPENEYSGKFYATRDIGVGEEILTDYDVYYTKWKLVGL